MKAEKKIISSSSLSSGQKIKLFRVVVDSKLPPDLIRLAICSVADNIMDYADKTTGRIKVTERRDLWGPEKEIFVSADNIEQELAEIGLDLSKSSSFRFEWDELVEGQVFLAGNFRMIEVPAEKTATLMTKTKVKSEFYVEPGAFSVTRIDTYIKSDIRRLYFSTLRGTRTLTVRSAANKGRK